MTFGTGIPLEFIRTAWKGFGGLRVKIFEYDGFCYELISIARGKAGPLVWVP